MQYDSDKYRMPLSAAQEEELINAATLEFLMRNPEYNRSDFGAWSWAELVERWSWEDPEWGEKYRDVFGIL